MSAILQAKELHDLYTILKNFRDRHTWVEIIEEYQVGKTYYMNVKFRD